jgi:hypothetical protein
LKKQVNLKKVLFLLIFLGIVSIFLGAYYKNILKDAGRFLAPEEMGEADVVVLEGTELIREDAARIGLELLSHRKAKQMVVVYQNSENEQIFAHPSNYSHFLTQKFEDMGLKKDQIRAIGVPADHPITLVEAKIVLSDLSKQGVKSAILLAEGFHTRRSFWTYKKIGLPLGIKIIPYPYFMTYKNENWWRDIDGVGAFAIELLKFFYYVLRGYVPVKSLLVT